MHSFWKYGLAILFLCIISLFGYLFVSQKAIKTANDFVVVGYSKATKSFVFFSQENFVLDGLDGPYLLKKERIDVDENNKLIRKTYIKSEPIRVQFANADIPSFTVKPNLEKSQQVSSSKLANRVLAVSDIQGNSNAFVSLLRSFDVIDDKLNWTFEQNELLLVGNMVGKGKDVTAILWLIYKLEQEAIDAGGRVSFVLGDQEIMLLNGNWKDTAGKYKALANQVGLSTDTQENYKSFFSKNNFIANWLRSKYALLKRDDFIFVHAGLHPDLADLDMNVHEINEYISSGLENIDRGLEVSSDKTHELLFGPFGPFWYRGAVEDRYKGENKLESRQLNRILNGFEVSRMIVGHTVVEEISTDYSGRVVRIGVEHSQQAYDSQTQGFLIEEGELYRINASGTRAPL